MITLRSFIVFMGKRKERPRCVIMATGFDLRHRGTAQVHDPQSYAFSILVLLGRFPKTRGSIGPVNAIVSEDWLRCGGTRMDIVKSTLSRRKFLGSPDTVNKPPQQDVSVTRGIIVCRLKEKIVSASPVCGGLFPLLVSSGWLGGMEAKACSRDP